MAPETSDLDRGQLVLISAVTIAFILLGVVVVFNGVLYTQTLSSSASGQTVSDAERTAVEVIQGVQTIAEQRDEVAVDPDEDDSGPFIDGIDTFLVQYQNQATTNRPVVVSSDPSPVSGTYAIANLSAGRTVSDADIYGVALTLERGDLDDDVTVKLSESTEVTISENDGTLEIEQGDDRCAIEFDEEPATIDFVTGTVHGAERTTCSASKLPPTMDGELVVTSENTEGVQLEVLIDDESSLEGSEHEESAVVAIEVGLEYATNDLTHSRTLEVSMPLGVSDS
ncbi:DUF7261 family protein [Natronosalvus rutilus]|uniref:Uncharacterized protein n=1 Tax=Natronosalvus rutilus TaxID=2953753 RepID=A0A9E7NBQ5_9EURY|nr:hypothetical protein [Natronosalvus rutilus]UTF54064.1 hypothetical protein NGM29_01900 [Natronosalvus rutilus]